MNNDPIIDKILQEIVRLQDLLLQLTALLRVTLSTIPNAGPLPPPPA
jgi:hypothetical protein